VILLVLPLVTAACSSSDDGSSGGGSTSAPAAQTSAAAAGGGGGTTIAAQNFAFSPDNVSVSAGKVTLTVTNKDGVEHTFTLDDGSSDTKLQPGSTQEIEIEVSKTVGWHCEIHPSMTGTITVT